VQHAKLDIDYHGGSPMSGVMTEEPNDDSLQLCRALCTKAGMLCEDISPLLILLGGVDRFQMRTAIRKAREVNDEVGQLLAAAEALVAS
jgi:hypothetical protein